MNSHETDDWLATRSFHNELDHRELELFERLIVQVGCKSAAPDL